MEVYVRMNPLHPFRKTRIAPTPSGYLHPGNALSFLTTAQLAQKTGARVLLRIDDMDAQRARPEYVQDIFDTLRFLQIGWDEGPRNPEECTARFAQRHRLALYHDALQQLRAGGHVFACTCSRSEILRARPDGSYPGTCRHKGIPLDTPGASWRLHTAPEQTLRVKHPDGSVTTDRLPDSMHAFVVRKKDGMPAYQLTSVVDDLHFDVDLIVRGADLWPSTLAQLTLASLLGQTRFLEASFYHHPLLTDADGNKLSKSAGAQSIRHLRENGRQFSDLQAFLTQSQAGENPVITKMTP
ncbi:glutamate--tRNA ligase family protein [Paraflavisolibacter sp. H34]|uniref:glutamate--tRNA ligase family protein n=1 Tax=Huijunlia imazamoxiresistens TaxID=3127457 RepID=UPI003017AF7A